MFWPNLLLDVSALGDQLRPEYNNLNPAQFSAGFSAMLLVYLPEELRGSVTENMLRHFNRLMNFAAVTDWSNVLGLNQQFTKSCEHHQMSYANWDLIHRWHERHFNSLRVLGGARGRGGQGNAGGGNNNNNGNNNNRNTEGDSRDPNFVPESFTRTQKMCFKYQKGQCDEKDNHVVGKTTLVHACALCAYKKRGTVPEHGSHNCPKRESNPKKKGF
jgi:hypothetical protein